MNAPYGELNSDEKLVVDSMLGVSDLNIVMAVHNPPRNTPEPGWTDATPWSWNMRATDNALKEGFIRFIHEQRAKYNIPKPAGRAGQKTHPAAWVWVELMDEAHFKLKSPLNDSDRNTLKKARKIARATGARLSKTLGAITRAAEKAGKTEDAERRFRNLLLLK